MLKLIETLKIKYFNTDKKVLNNILWLLFDNVVRRLIMLIVIAYTSRYLGVETFGIVNYATALMLFFTSFANLGIKSILIKEIVHLCVHLYGNYKIKWFVFMCVATIPKHNLHLYLFSF